MEMIKLPFERIFDFEHVLTPIAVEHIIGENGVQKRTFRLVYIFGIRVAFWATTEF
jgi:hypothetical protein